MAENIVVHEGEKSEKYRILLPQMRGLLEGEEDVTANMANFVAALRMTFGFFWVGFYIVKGENLILGPFQGPVACTRIGYGKGVCGTAWKEKRCLTVEDVNAFPGHIACSSDSKSEIVYPVIREGEVVAVLDIDSDDYAAFDVVDEEYGGKLWEMFLG